MKIKNSVYWLIFIVGIFFVAQNVFAQPIDIGCGWCSSPLEPIDIVKVIVRAFLSVIMFTAMLNILFFSVLAIYRKIKKIKSRVVDLKIMLIKILKTLLIIVPFLIIILFIDINIASDEPSILSGVFLMIVVWLLILSAWFGLKLFFWRLKKRREKTMKLKRIIINSIIVFLFCFLLYFVINFF